MSPAKIDETHVEDGNALRIRFLVEMFKYKDNESKYNIREDIQELIRRVRI
ncbi:hypothetical protein BDA96_10G134800 [Sorghum bicolor]|uniref:Uncharacterized protein n=2 Tax=Sorghum bicolor TaxID=4558 RepID=A0A921U056_SORBI|nr:hypothetical protein BDA96_10G134800 [Sorghum bicolor]KXG19751.1 hypothetical protein SORBI_3010G110400 [Sorghum bicolor]